MPAAYMIADVKVTDPEAYEDYKAQVPATIAKYGGEYLVRGGDFVALEGDAPSGRVVVLRFESKERALEWYNSDEYEGPKAIRHRAAVSRSFLVEGME